MKQTALGLSAAASVGHSSRCQLTHSSRGLSQLHTTAKAHLPRPRAQAGSEAARAKQQSRKAPSAGSVTPQADSRAASNGHGQPVNTSPAQDNGAHANGSGTVEFWKQFSNGQKAEQGSRLNKNSSRAAKSSGHQAPGPSPAAKNAPAHNTQQRSSKAPAPAGNGQGQSAPAPAADSAPQESLQAPAQTPAVQQLRQDTAAARQGQPSTSKPYNQDWKSRSRQDKSPSQLVDSQRGTQQPQQDAGGSSPMTLRQMLDDRWGGTECLKTTTAGNHNGLLCPK